MGKSSINGPFSTAMLNNQRVYYTDVLICISRPACGRWCGDVGDGICVGTGRSAGEVLGAVGLGFFGKRSLNSWDFR